MTGGNMQGTFDKEIQFKIMYNTFEELFDKKLEPQQVALWRKFLVDDNDYPARYFIKAVELAGELKWMPKIAEIIERFDEYQREDVNRYQRLPEPKDRQKEVSRKWMAQIKTIISPRYAGKLRSDFDWRLLGKLYEPDELKELLDKNLKEAI
jgi:hypothetical protein